MKKLIESVSVDEDWRRSLATGALATSLALGGANVTKADTGSSNSRTNSHYSSNNSSSIVAEVIAGEAAGEGELGMRAVACCIQNRGGNPVHTVTRRHQFSAYDDKALMHRNYKQVKPIADKIASEIGHLKDITGGATNYVTKALYDREKDNPDSWISKMRVTKVIGHHVFLRSS